MSQVRLSTHMRLSSALTFQQACCRRHRPMPKHWLRIWDQLEYIRVSIPAFHRARPAPTWLVVRMFERAKAARRKRGVQ